MCGQKLSEIFPGSRLRERGFSTAIAMAALPPPCGKSNTEANKMPWRPKNVSAFPECRYLEKREKRKANHVRSSSQFREWPLTASCVGW